jgi:long-subunit fatty acid transport protein
MKLGWASLFIAGSAQAGGLFLPGSGAISTSRAGAAVASADDGEALSVNPAGLAKTHGWVVTVSAAFIDYAMQFSRRGTYDQVQNGDEQGYEGQPYPTVKNRSKPPLGIGSYQPIPVIAVVTDLGGRIPHLHLAAGLFAPNAYPFRDMTNGFPLANWANDNAGKLAPPSRYDVLKAESAVIYPSIAAAYSILPTLDVGARFSAGNANAKTTLAVWGTPNNVEESIRNDALFTADVKDGFVPAFAVGANFRPTRHIEVGAVYNSKATLKLEGTALAINGPSVDKTKAVGPIPSDVDLGPDRPRCKASGDFAVGGKTPVCISLDLPQTASVGARYKLLDPWGRERGDLELDVGWENWGKRCDFSSADAISKNRNCTSPGQYLVNVDAGLYVNNQFQQPLEVSTVDLNLRDTYAVRLGGSYHIPLDDGSADPAGWPNRIVLRGGVGFDTQAARDHWLRAVQDGAARLTTAVGAAYKTPKWELDLGMSYIYEGTTKNGGANADGTDCNPTRVDLFCAGQNQDRPLNQRQGPDPTDPLLPVNLQKENPVNQGTFKSHYLLFMLGYSHWF